MRVPDKSPVIIAHRGASGYLPEHTLPAKALAYGMGADFLEQDLVASRDGALLVLHDLWLDDVSNVARLFPSRCREDGHFYCVDFDLAEIRTLHFFERLTPGTTSVKYPHRFPHKAGGFSVMTLHDDIEFVNQLNVNSGKRIGIYPELKAPQWHLEQGIDLTGLVLDALTQHDYIGSDKPIFLQCFDTETLKQVRQRTGQALPLIQLLSSKTKVDEQLLQSIAEYADGIGPSLKLILHNCGPGGEFTHSGLVQLAHANGLAVHPYTFRADDLPTGCPDLETLLQICIDELGIDGLFTDFTDRAFSYRERAH